MENPSIPKILSAERIASHRANGYLYPNDALSPAEVAHPPWKTCLPMRRRR